jgi:hypothetical protein
VLVAGLVLGAALVAGSVAAPGPAAAGTGATVVSRQAAPDDPQLPIDPTADPERARETADEILQGDEYQEPEGRDRTWLDRVRRWISDRLPDLGGAGARAGSELISFLVLVVLALGAIAALTYVLVGTRSRRRADDEVDAEVDVSPLRTADEWDAEAARCEAAGDHRGAVRARFRSLTTALARRGLVADTPGRTAGEMRGDVTERAPALVAPFGAAADLFEEVWFGARTAGSDDARAARDLGRAALAAAPRRAAALEGGEAG